MSISIHELTKTDLEFALFLINQVGWQSETESELIRLIQYPGGKAFLAEKDLQKSGICFTTAYQNAGFIGILIVDESMRGIGIGTALMTAALDYFHDSGINSVYLDADLEAVPLYSRLGFSKLESSLRFYGKIKPISCKNISLASEVDLEQIALLDSRVFHQDRSYFLASSINDPEYQVWIEKSTGGIISYLGVRPGNNIYSLGPWFLADSADPNTILENVSYELDNPYFRVGLLESQVNGVNFFDKLPEIERQQPCIRMVYGPDVKLGSHPFLWANGSGAKG